MADGFHCPKCGLERTRVFDTRPVLTNQASSILRQRICERCDHVFQTTERIYKRPARKLDLQMVKVIRRLWAGGTPQAKLAREFEVSKRTIWNVVHFEQWVPAHHKIPPQPGGRVAEGNRGSQRVAPSDGVSGHPRGESDAQRQQGC